MNWIRGFGHFVARTLYAKVRAYLLGGTAAAGVAGGILWAVAALGADVTPAVAGVVTTGAALLVGLFVAYETRETRTPAGAPTPLTGTLAPDDVSALADELAARLALAQQPSSERGDP